MTEPILVVDSDPEWPRTFARLRTDLRQILADVDVLVIEHVGSTAVRGLAAKPIIDVDVVVRREEVDAAIVAMQRAGYAYLGDLGIDDRHAFRAPGGTRRNVYVTVEGCASLRNHLGVRDVLRADAGLRDEYGALKKELAARFTSDEIDQYVEGKSAVLQRVLAQAGFSDDELRAAEQDNRAARPGVTRPGVNGVAT